MFDYRGIGESTDDPNATDSLRLYAEDLIQASTLIIHAGKDMVTGPRTTQPLEHGISDAEGVTMKNAAHAVAGKGQKIEFCNMLFRFLDKH